MTVPTHAPISAALVRRARAMPTWSALSGGIHEGFAPEKTPYPLATYNLVYAPYEWDWTSPMLIGGYDVSVFSRLSVEADNLDAALADWLAPEDGAIPFPVD